MARVTAAQVLQTKAGILDAAKLVLSEQGFAGLSTRSVAAAAGVPLSQIQYHFGSKQGMLLALFEYMNEQLLERQSEMFANPNLSFAEKWAIACDYLDADIESGYVRVFQELIAAGWSNPEIGAALRDGLMGWIELLTAQAAAMLERHRPGQLFDAHELAALVGAAFTGAEASILLGLEDGGVPYRGALRRFGELIALLEEKN